MVTLFPSHSAMAAWGSMAADICEGVCQIWSRVWAASRMALSTLPAADCFFGGSSGVTDSGMTGTVSGA